MSTAFSKSVPGRTAVLPPKPQRTAKDMLPASLLRGKATRLPEMAELDVVRHFTELSHKNFCVDGQFYPLGSCTMKYNPRFAEHIAAQPGFTRVHPLMAQLHDAYTQGSLEVMWDMERHLCEITGMDAFTLHPMAGAHGELAGVMLIAAYHRDRGNKKTKMIVPDSSHGTNPASAVLAGYDIVNIPSKDGIVDPEALDAVLDDDVAGLMMTCPNTLGLFETHLPAVVEKLRKVDALLYYDGANANAILGKMRVGDVGFDVIHFNLHKTFSTPHGGGGPGSGPVGVSARLTPYLPVSRVCKKDDGSFHLKYDYPKTIGYVAPFYGNFCVMLKAYAYILRLGAEGLTRASEHAVLNANYLRKKLEKTLSIPYNRICLHEFVATPGNSPAHALDIAKGLIDNNIHPPTVYFPLIVKEALMIEPPETENKQTLDRFVAVMEEIMRTAATDIEALHAAPTKSPVRRLDETAAARNVDITDTI